MLNRIPLALLLALSVSLPAIADESFIWIEGENPAQAPSGSEEVKGIELPATNNPEMLSGNAMLRLMLTPDDAAKTMSEGPLVFRYDFTADRGGTYQLWMRIGYARSRSDFDYQIDDGPWRTVAKNQPTRDIYELSHWNPISWLQAQAVKLSAGKHTIAFRHRPFVFEGKAQRTLHMLDAICLTPDGDWLPNGKHKPGADYKTDSDHAAARRVYEMPSAPSGQRTDLRLTGLWEIARWDELTVEPGTRLTMPETLPEMDKLHWYGIEVPGDRNAKRPDMKYAHRYLYRTKVRVPADMTDRGWVLRLERFSMIAAVFVNGQRRGWSRNCQSVWSCDISGAIRPGEVNEIVVAIKDVIYGLDPSRKASRRGENLSAYWYVPLRMTFHQSLGLLMDMPVSWGHGGMAETGLAEPAILTATGKVYTEDVFAIPSVSDKKLDLEVTVHNPTGEQTQVTVENEVGLWIPDGAGKGTSRPIRTGRYGGGVGPAEKTFEPRKLAIQAGESATVKLSAPWDDPRLWFPDDPNLYVVVTTIKLGDEVIDTRHTRFGFRQWGWEESRAFTCNDVPWIFWCYASHPDSVADLLAHCRATGQNSIRYSLWATHIVDRDPRKISTSELLDELDEHGIVVRFNSLFDGEVANYGTGLTQDGKTTYNRALFGHLKDQFTQWVKGYRNHPSVLIWSLDNEVVYVNANNLGQGPQWEPATRLLAEHVMTIDPTRPVMVDGGRALRDPADWKGVDDEVRELGHLPVNGCHYNELKGYDLRDYPDAAYSAERWYTVPMKRGPWPMLRDRPIFMGECFFAGGWSLAKFASIGGERCFLGYPETYPARARFMRWLSEGYRWNHTVAAWDFGLRDTADDFRIAWKPIVLLSRQWTEHMTAGRKNPRLLKAINQTSRPARLRLAWALAHQGRKLAKGDKTVTLEPGGMLEWPVQIEAPDIARPRLDATLTLTVDRDGEEIFRDERPMRLYAQPDSRLELPAGMKVYVMDAGGTIEGELNRRDVAFTAVESVKDIPLGRNLVIVGPDAIDPDEATDPTWQLLAAEGARLLILEQEHPLKYQALPADLEPTGYDGRLAFAENPAHPVFAHIHPDDLSLWSGDHLTYKNAYRKADRGAVSLVQCDEELSCTALAQCRLAGGLMLLCQMRIGSRLGTDVVADRLLSNLLSYAVDYKVPHKTAAIVIDADDPRGRLLGDLRLKGHDVDDPVRAISGQEEIAIVAASPENLSALAKAPDELRDFTEAGGWLVLWGLEPDGLEDFNRIVGVDHLIRPYAPELPELNLPRDPLAAGITYRELIMTTGQRIARFSGTEWMSPHAFGHVVDYRDVAPFCTINGAKPTRQTPRMPNPRNAVNNLGGDASWRYLYYLHQDEGEPDHIKLDLPRRETPSQLIIRFSIHYVTVSEITVQWSDGHKLTLETRPDESIQRFKLPARETDELTVRFSQWRQVGNRPVIGVQNLSLLVRRDRRFLETVRPLTTPAGLVRYPMGDGGVVLNQLHIREREANGLNAAKKSALVRTLLSNLGASFVGSKPVIVGGRLEFDPVTIAPERFNAYLDQTGRPGWFRPRRRAPKQTDFSALPKGNQRLAGAVYEVFDFKTSPAAAALMLAGPGSTVETEAIEKLPVEGKADALFFLHTCNPGRSISRWQELRASRPDRAGDPPVVLRYRIRYADGQTRVIPVAWGRGVGPWLAEDEPADLPQAALAWSAPAQAGSDWTLAAWSMQWNNPRPEVAIDSIDILGPAEGKPPAAPAVLGISTATVAD